MDHRLADFFWSQSLLHQRRDSHVRHVPHGEQGLRKVSTASPSAKGFPQNEWRQVNPEIAHVSIASSSAGWGFPTAVSLQPAFPVASSSAKGFPRFDVDPPLWRRSKSQSLLHQRVGGFRQPSAYSREPAFRIASSSAKGFPRRIPRRAGFAWMGLNRFFISEGIRNRRCQVSGCRRQVKDTPSSTQQAGRARAQSSSGFPLCDAPDPRSPASSLQSPASTQSLLGQRRDSHTFPAGLNFLGSPCLNRFFVSEEIPTR